MHTLMQVVETYHFILLGPEIRAECLLTNDGESRTNFTPHLFISYHMEEQNNNTLQCNMMKHTVRQTRLVSLHCLSVSM